MRPRNTGPTQAVRDQVYDRDGFRCVRCDATDGPFAIHHRLPRGRGGDNRLSNLILLCDLGCHRTVESHREQSYTDGYLVRTGHDPATVPVVWNGVRVLLEDDGSVQNLEPEGRFVRCRECGWYVTDSLGTGNPDRPCNGQADHLTETCEHGYDALSCVRSHGQAS